MYTPELNRRNKIQAFKIYFWIRVQYSQFLFRKNFRDILNPQETVAVIQSSNKFVNLAHLLAFVPLSQKQWAQILARICPYHPDWLLCAVGACWWCWNPLLSANNQRSSCMFSWMQNVPKLLCFLYNEGDCTSKISYCLWSALEFPEDMKDII